MLRRTFRRFTNLTSLTNKRSNMEELLSKPKNSFTQGSRNAMIRKDRDEMKNIHVIHESPKIMIASRNRCNRFQCNQYAVVSKQTGEAVMIDASDDWMDDWVSFFNSGDITLKTIFFTHLHVDNIVNLSPLVSMVEESRGNANVAKSGDDIWGNERTVGFAWNMADRVWLDYYPQACRKYGRHEMASVNMQAMFLAPLSSAPSKSDRKLHENYHMKDILLTGATNRSDSFLMLGDTLLFYVATPGHSPGHMMLHIPEEKLLFTGDLLFFNGVGRVDLPYGAADVMAQSLRVLEDFPDHTVVLPGHERLTTLGKERRENKALQRVYELLATGHKVPRVGDNAGFL